MDRRQFLAGVGIGSLAGCLGGSGGGCPEASVVSVTVVAGERTTPTPGTDTPTPAPITEDFVVVTVRNDGDDVRTLTGYVVANEGRREVSRAIPAGVGKRRIRFGPFDHNTIDDYSFSFADC